MSGKVSGWVWDQPLPQNEKFVLLAYADHADHEGENIFPSINLMAYKTGYSRSSIQRITKRLREKGYLVAVGEGISGVNKYCIPIGGCHFDTPPTDGGSIAVEGGGSIAMKRGGVTATTPKPSVNRQEPSVKRLSSDSKKEWDKFLLAWAQYFPHKVQPRVNNLTLQKKLASRLKDKYFRENYSSALYEAAGSSFINTSSWMQADWFLKNDENWEKCLDGKYRDNGDPKQSTKDATMNVLKEWIVEEGVDEP